MPMYATCDCYICRPKVKEKKVPAAKKKKDIPTKVTSVGGEADGTSVPFILSLGVGGMKDATFSLTAGQAEDLYYDLENYKDQTNSW